MPLNSSRVKALIDTDASVTLRNVADGAETANATEASVSLKELDTAYWHDGNDIPAGVFEVNVNIAAVDVANADETYTFNLIVDDVSAMNDTPRVVASLAFAAGLARVGSYRMYVASDQIKYLDPDTSGSDKFLAIQLVVGGTSPSITYGAQIGEVVKA